MTRDRGTTVSSPVDVGAAPEMKNMALPEVFAAQGDRAVSAVLGTTTPGAAQGADPGKDHAIHRHLYVARRPSRGACPSPGLTAAPRRA